MWPFLAAPGADDDGSGSMTILESYRGLLAANFTRGCHAALSRAMVRLTPASGQLPVP
jgi:Zn-dependent M28 family amino/carboxypeptidase